MRNEVVHFQCEEPGARARLMGVLDQHEHPDIPHTPVFYSHTGYRGDGDIPLVRQYELEPHYSSQVDVYNAIVRILFHTVTYRFNDEVETQFHDMIMELMKHTAMTKIRHGWVIARNCGRIVEINRLPDGCYRATLILFNPLGYEYVIEPLLIASIYVSRLPLGVKK